MTVGRSQCDAVSIGLAKLQVGWGDGIESLLLGLMPLLSPLALVPLTWAVMLVCACNFGGMGRVMVSVWVDVGM